MLTHTHPNYITAIVPAGGGPALPRFSKHDTRHIIKRKKKQQITWIMWEHVVWRRLAGSMVHIQGSDPVMTCSGRENLMFATTPQSSCMCPSHVFTDVEQMILEMEEEDRIRGWVHNDSSVKSNMSVHFHWKTTWFIPLCTSGLAAQGNALCQVCKHYFMSVFPH